LGIFIGLVDLVFLLGRAPASQGRHIPGFASLGASHASPLHAAHAKTLVATGKLAIFSKNFILEKTPN
jgi:hypothetical protein